MVITSWKELISVLGTLSEQELKDTINFEVSTYKRKNVIARLHQRYTKLKAKREREELIAGRTLL